ncbi:uncharacterized protein [Primulina huaijiensis]|uniref:uncharacterized protein n=1 Tax=Primulina huaijiensis TaxID=1492673 RepID=UPI003CC78A6F
MRAKIRKEIGDAKLCSLVDEARDASNKEQMAIILRFVDTEGFLRERFFAIVHVTDTTAATLKKEISDALSCYDLYIINIRGQGYDGASNMRGSWNGLQALFLKDCSFAYYVHCFAHRLQLALTATAEKELMVNVIQTHWSSNFDSLCSMIDMYSSVITVLENMMNDGASNSIRGEASDNGDNKSALSTLQEKSLDILSAMNYVSTTKTLLRTLREEGFDLLLSHVKEVCVKYNIEIPHMEAHYKSGTGRSCQHNDSITIEHHYQFDVFIAAIDFQIEELNNRFKDDAVELLKFSCALEPKENFKLLNVDHIY